MKGRLIEYNNTEYLQKLSEISASMRWIFRFPHFVF
jgi:hypothetical protein